MIKLSLDWRVCLLLLWSFHFITLLSILWLQADATPYWSETILGQMSQSFFFFCENQRLGEIYIVQT